MKAFWIDRETNTAKVVETDGRLGDLYEMCHCRCIDIAVRSVAGRDFEFVVDDEGLLKDKPMGTAFDRSGTPQLVGSVVVFAPADECGNLTGLTGTDIEVLENNTGMALMSDMTSRTIIIID